MAPIWLEPASQREEDLKIMGIALGPSSALALSMIQ